MPVLRQKAEEFIEARLITDTLADQIIQTIEQMRGASRLINEVGDGDAGAQEPSDGTAQDRAGVRLSRDQLFKELADREEKLQSSSEDGITDQYPSLRNEVLFLVVYACPWFGQALILQRLRYRVYQYIIGELQSDRPLRLMVQASAGLNYVRR